MSTALTRSPQRVADLRRIEGDRCTVRPRGDCQNGRPFAAVATTSTCFGDRHVYYFCGCGKLNKVGEAVFQQLVRRLPRPSAAARRARRS
jgi:hypothetical protein